MITALGACAIAALTGCTTPPVYKINAAAKSPDARNLTGNVALDVRGTLVQRGYPVVLDNPRGWFAPPVVNVDVTFDRRETARLDVWRTYEGTAEAKVLDEGTLRGEKAFKATGKRADTEIDAEAGVRKALAAQLSAWLIEVLPPPGVAK